MRLETEDSAVHTEVQTQGLKRKRCQCLRSMCSIGALAKVAGSFGVKLKILVSLYQVLNGLGMIFNIPYPENYQIMLSAISSIELNLPTVLPLDCLLGGISFAHVLVIQTAGPLVIIGTLTLLATLLQKKSAAQSAKTGQPTVAERRRAVAVVGDGEEPLGAFLAEVFSNVSFFLLFLLYPGSSTKVFNALLCVGFSGEGEVPQRFLRVDFSIDCGSSLYTNFIFPYAIVMIVVYPVGVPLFYALTLSRNKAELNKLRNLELSAAAEAKRIELGSRLRGKELREYQPEIDEATERKAMLEDQYTKRRSALPGNLRKLTSGYEMRT